MAEGPATAALRAKKEARAAVLKEMNDKLKAVDAGDMSVVTPAAKPRRKAVTPVDGAQPPKPRKKKAPEA